MDRLIVEGGARLAGTVAVSGSKNACLPIMAACLLAEGKSTLHGAPQVDDVHGMGEVLAGIGVAVERNGEDLSINTNHITTTHAPDEHAPKMRASIWVLGPLAARCGRARVMRPGGCSIGTRPIAMHLTGLQAMGARVELSDSHVDVRVPASRLRGARIALGYPSVGATANLMMAACLADGETIIDNAAREPEMRELADALRLMGARITGDGTGRITIQGQTSLRPMSCHIGPDRIEAATFMAGAAATGGDVCVRGARPEHLAAVTAVLRQMGCTVEEGDGVRVVARERLRAVDLCTGPYPAFPTDVQPQLMVCAALAQGTSCLRETVHDDRLSHASALAQMGARIAVTGDRAVVEGQPRLQGACVAGGDLRAVAALVLAGLAGTGTTEVTGLHHLDRGYERFEEKLCGLGARVTRV
ncbi:MAG: UDP-N-acetylglucosamine 1-carboxyvinyltransferase [Myxococcota bacterium]